MYYIFSQVNPVLSNEESSVKQRDHSVSPFASAMSTLGLTFTLGCLAAIGWAIIAQGLLLFIDWPTTVQSLQVSFGIAFSLGALLGVGLAIDADRGREKAHAKIRPEQGKE